MVEYGAGQLHGALSQRFVHVNESGQQESSLVARLISGGFVTRRMSDSAFFVQRYDMQAAKAGGEQLHAPLSATDFLFDSRDEKTKIRPAQLA